MARRPVVLLTFIPDQFGEDLEEHLSRRGHDVRVCTESWGLEPVLAAGQVDVAVIGPAVSQMEAQECLRRHARPGGPLFLLVAHAPTLVDKVLALEMGAADVVEATIGLRELSARIGGLAARRGKASGELVVLENSTVDLRSAIVMHRSGAEEQLSAGQVALLRLFLCSAGKVLSRNDIVAAAPAESVDAFDRSIDSRIVRLRRKLDTESIVTIRGAGYRFDPPADIGADD